MNPKLLRDWTYEELMDSCAGLVIQAITKGEPLVRAMRAVDTLTNDWRSVKPLPPRKRP